MKTNWQAPLAIALSISLLTATGCHRSAKKGKTIPRTGPTIDQIYREGAVGSGSTSSRDQDLAVLTARPISNGTKDLRGYTREGHSELRQLFPQVNNPILVTYIYPHLTAGGLPVPGYTTAFRMYPMADFALPGEVLPMDQPTPDAQDNR